MIVMGIEHIAASWIHFRNFTGQRIFEHPKSRYAIACLKMSLVVPVLPITGWNYGSMQTEPHPLAFKQVSITNKSIVWTLNATFVVNVAWLYDVH
jgi:hypothetical protein